ncbi:hypothetical protein G7Y31_01400 [Corynebacterium lizhenjunii]|uniref:Uncharacterized protein n=1 Tax=Corynebacterium lizhenjunii TaxID=2709394 RepID=A0A7T0KFL1_9CORY|nr:hypothetical protein [Corynebacterium lizhenjunii]QPK79405.1 hypothetical protein G7Y31_01400 [Corynebacterium lizhenjunii]
MAEEKQLTVAELLARNKKDQPDTQGEAPRRRRRRSLEEGGVSVAELTGNLAKVDATPAEAKHSSVGIDETAPVIPAPAEKTAEERRAAEIKAAEETKRAEFAKKAEEARRRQAAEKAAAAEKQAVAVKDAEQKAAAGAPKSAAPKPAASPSADDTAIIERVKDEPQPAAQPVSEAASTPAAQQEALAASKPAAQQEALAASKPAAQPAPRSAADVEPAHADDDLRDDVAAVEDIEDLEDDEDSGINPVSVILLALVGIVLGAVVFKGFEILWGSFNRVVVAVLAVAVTGAIGGIIHALRTGKSTLVLGVIVGLILTFGPLLIL